MKLMRLTMDPVRVIPRPFWWYVALWVGQELSQRYVYRRLGLVKVSLDCGWCSYLGVVGVS
jgi:hypothetical protein